MCQITRTGFQERSALKTYHSVISSVLNYNYHNYSSYKTPLQRDTRLLAGWLGVRSYNASSLRNTLQDQILYQCMYFFTMFFLIDRQILLNLVSLESLYLGPWICTNLLPISLYFQTSSPLMFCSRALDRTSNCIHVSFQAWVCLSRPRWSQRRSGVLWSSRKHRTSLRHCLCKEACWSIGGQVTSHFKPTNLCLTV